MEAWTGGSGTGRIAGVLCLLATAAATAPAAGQETRTIDETRAVSGSAAVEVEVTVRRVRIRGWDRDELRVQGEFRPDREEFEIEVEGSSVEVSLEAIHGRWDEDARLDGELTVSVPRGARLTVEVRAGGVDVQGVDGDVDLETVSGDVSYAGGAATVRAESVSGDVSVGAPRATSTHAESVSGDVRVEVAGGAVDVASVSGRVEVRASDPVERLGVEAVSGGILVDARPATHGTFDLETHSGNVEVRLPGDLDARLEAETFSGSIANAFGGEEESTSRYTSEKELHQTVGSGSASVSAHTFSGGIRFVRGGGSG